MDTYTRHYQTHTHIYVHMLTYRIQNPPNTVPINYARDDANTHTQSRAKAMWSAVVKKGGAVKLQQAKLVLVGRACWRM